MLTSSLFFLFTQNFHETLSCSQFSYFKHNIHYSHSTKCQCPTLVSVSSIIPAPRSTPASVTSAPTPSFSPWARGSLVSIFGVWTVPAEMPSLSTLVTSHAGVKSSSASPPSPGSGHGHPHSSTTNIHPISSTTGFISILLVPINNK